MTEAGGVPVGLAVAGANEVDFKLARRTVESVPVPRPAPTKTKPQGMCLDKGYDYLEVWELLEEFGFTAHVAIRGGDEGSQAVQRKARHKARRWVVERTHSWMNRLRGVLVRWAKKPQNYLAQLHLACAVITYRCAGLFG
jgi:putative transposase